MIFVTLGTHGAPFTRLIRALDALPADELVVQYGHSPEPVGVQRAVAFMPFSEVLELIDRAAAVITHAGVGSILCATRAGHTPIVAARRADHGEHVDDHQLELAAALGERGMVVPAWELDGLAEAVRALPPRRPPAAPVERPLHAAVRTALSPPSPRSANRRLLRRR